MKIQMLLLVALFALPAFSQGTQQVATITCDKPPDMAWQAVFQWPETAEQAQVKALWKVNFQELVSSRRLSADAASFLLANSRKAAESQGKAVEQYVIAYNPCTRQMMVDYELEGSQGREATDPNVLAAAMNLAAAEIGRQQPAASLAPSGAAPPSGGFKGPSVGSQIASAAISGGGFAFPPLFAAMPVAGLLGDGLQKMFVGTARIAGVARPKDGSFRVTAKSLLKDF